MKRTIFALLMLFAFPANAATFPAKTCSHADVLAAIDQASPGDIITVPAGDCTWADKISIRKPVSIIGSGIGKTIITANYAFSFADATYPYDIIDGWRISGFTFNNNGGRTKYAINATRVANFRIDNNQFNGYATNMRFNYYCKGVVDHNQFLKNSGSGIYLYGDKVKAWERPTGLGTDDFVFFEDNIFKTEGVKSSHFVVGNLGAKYVFRYNIIEETKGGYNAAWIDAHGSNGHEKGKKATRGTRAFEIYENLFFRDHDGCCRGLFLRGGTGVVFNNIFDESKGKFNRRIDLVEYRVALFKGGGSISPSAGWCMSEREDAQRYCIAPPGSKYYKEGFNTRPCRNDADCGSGICSPYGEGYPCLDQIGRGGPGQAVEPLYMWGNVNHNNEPIPIFINERSKKYIRDGRDYYSNTPKPGYKPFTYPHPLVATQPKPVRVEVKEPKQEAIKLIKKALQFLEGGT